MEDNIILVDENGKELGAEEKLSAHRTGKLHRAFSIFIFNSKGELMLQQRAKGKYHSGGLWANTCCSHPRPGEATEAAARRRLKEEMGLECELLPAGFFIYRAELDGGCIEHEYDHIFTGHFDQDPALNPLEAGDWKWIGLEELKHDLEANPANYAYWLKEAIKKCPAIFFRAGSGNQFSPAA